LPNEIRPYVIIAEGRAITTILAALGFCFLGMESRVELAKTGSFTCPYKNDCEKNIPEKIIVRIFRAFIFF
jgi:hypothetical protein